MKLADVLKAGVQAEIEVQGGEAIVLGGPHETHRIEKVDDAEQSLTLLTLLGSGRRKGQKARMVLPYASIRSVTLPM